MNVSGVRERLRVDLREAMKERDKIAVRVIRSLLAAIDNAEAVSAAESSSGGAHVAKAALGAGAGDRPRRELSGDDLAMILQAEIDERVTAKAEYQRGGRENEAAEIVQEIASLAQYSSLTRSGNDKQLS